MVYFKTTEEIELMRENAVLVSKTLAEVGKYIDEGVTTAILDKIAEEYIRDNGAVPGFKDYNGYPATLCVSINEQVVHGIPSEIVLKDGDIVSIDCGTIKNGFYGDSAFTFEVGNVNEETKKLLRVTKESLYIGIEKSKVGNRVGDISSAIQDYVEKFGYSVVRELVGHGLGKHLHEEPQIPNYGRRGTGMMLREGLVLCIEPMINLGKKNIYQEKDGWTIRTADRKPSAHFELTVAIRNDSTEVLSTFDYIEEVIKQSK